MSQKGYIYIVRTDNGLCKIGTARNVELRIRKLPFPVQLIHSISADNVGQAERMLHDKYRKYLVGGEWFRLDQDQIAALKCIVHIQGQATKTGSVQISGLASEVVSTLNAQSSHLGYKGRGRYLRQVIEALANTTVEVIDEAISNGRFGSKEIEPVKTATILRNEDGKAISLTEAHELHPEIPRSTLNEWGTPGEA